MDGLHLISYLWGDFVWSVHVFANFVVDHADLKDSIHDYVLPRVPSTKFIAILSSIAQQCDQLLE